MILTVTLAPALDRTYVVPRFERGALHRATAVTDEASGKGINVTRLLAATGVPTVALFPGPAEPLGRLLEADGIPHRRVDTDVPTRVNTTIVDDEGTTTKVNAAAGRLGPVTSAGLVAALDDLLAEHSPTWVALSGAIPPGAEDLLAALSRTARERGALVAVDTSGPPLAAALEAGVDLVKPNTDELAELVGTASAPDGSADVREWGVLAARVATRHATGVLLTLGSQGAVYAAEDLLLHALPPAVPVVNTTGAGDATLAGWLAGSLHEATDVGRLRAAVAAGAGAVQTPGTAEPPTHPVDPAAVRVDAVRPAAGGTPQAAEGLGLRG